MTGTAARFPDPAELPPDLAEYQRAIKSGAPGEHLYVGLLGLSRHDPLSLVREVERGLPYRAFERFQRNSSLSTQELAEVVDVPLRTLHRRKAQGRLGRDESDRLVRFSRVFGHALELFEGDPDATLRWLFTPLRALSNQRPLELARTDVGTQQIEQLIGRLEHGVMS